MGDYPTKHTFTMDFKKITVKEGTKNSNDSMTIVLKMPFKEYEPTSKTEEMTMAGYLGHIWKQSVKVILQRPKPKEGSFNDPVEFVGKAGAFKLKDYQDGAGVTIPFSGEFKQENFTEVGKYILKKVKVKIVIINPDLAKGKDVENNIENES